MVYSFGNGMAAGLLLLAGGCAANTEVTLPPLDASPTRTAAALVVEVTHMQGFAVPDGVVRGAGQGAAHGMGAYLSSAGGGADLSALALWIILMPIALPVSAAIGAGMAHSPEEVEAAAAAFNGIATDSAYVGSIDHRIADVLAHDSATGWACLKAASTPARKSCAGHGPAAQLMLYPNFEMLAPRGFNPEVSLAAEITAELSMRPDAAGEEGEILLAAKWNYRQKLGKFFALAANDGLLLRSKMDDILDRFATRIAEDLYLAPGPSTFRRRELGGGAISTEIPERTVVRVAQGRDVPSSATHGAVRPKGRDCWIDAIDDRSTDHGRDTAVHGRQLPVRAGHVRVDVTCIAYPGSVKETLESRSIALTVEPGMTYETDGRSYESLEE